MKHDEVFLGCNDTFNLRWTVCWNVPTAGPVLTEALGRKLVNDAFNGVVEASRWRSRPGKRGEQDDVWWKVVGQRQPAGGLLQSDFSSGSAKAPGLSRCCSLMAYLFHFFNSLEGGKGRKNERIKEEKSPRKRGMAKALQNNKNKKISGPRPGQYTNCLIHGEALGHRRAASEPYQKRTPPARERSYPACRPCKSTFGANNLPVVELHHPLRDCLFQTLKCERD